MEAVQKFLQMLKDSAIMRQQVYQLLFALLTLIGAKVDLPFIQEQGEAAVDGILTTASAIMAAWTMFTRATKPAPNLTEAANDKEKELVNEGKIPMSNATSSVVTEIKSEQQQRGSVRVSFLTGLGIVSMSILACVSLVGCPASVNPMAAAQNTEQKTYAAYGTVTIFAERGAALVSDPALSDSLKKPVAQAIVAVKGPMDAALEGLKEVDKIRYEVEAGADHDERLLIAASNLDKYYLQLEPLVGKLVNAVTLAIRCRSFTGQELVTCQQGGGS